MKRGRRKREHEGEEIRQAKMVEVSTEGRGSESATSSERWGERGGPSGGTEHHVIVPWKSWAARRRRGKSVRHRARGEEREGTRAGQF